MRSFENYVIISDGDGTLIGPDHEIPARNLDAIRSFVDRAGVFVLATGRPKNGAGHVTSKIPGLSLSVFFNGAMVYDHTNGNVLYSDPLPSGMEAPSRYVLENHPKVGLECFTAEEAWILQDSFYTREHFALLKEEPRFLSPDDLPAAGILKMFITGETEDLEEVRAALTENFPDMFNAVRSSGVYLEIFSRTSNKGKALQYLRSHFGGKRKMIAIGDGFNDVSMFREADGVFVPEDGEERIKSYGTVVCPSGRGAVADVIERLEKEAVAL